MPPLAADRTAVIPGRVTAGLTGPDATRTVLQDAARITVDHGAQFFRLVRTDARQAYDVPGYGYNIAIRPGAAVTIRVYQAGDVRADAPGVWDAEKILTSGVPDSALAAATVAPVHPGAQKSTPRCTAYGCVW